MPRNIRCLSVVLALILLAGLAGQAAQALPVNGPPVNDTTAGAYLTAFWGWFADGLGNLGRSIGIQVQHLTTALEKDGPQADPNGSHGH